MDFKWNVLISFLAKGAGTFLDETEKDEASFKFISRSGHKNDVKKEI